MLFSSISFIYYFLPITLLLYFMAPKKLRNYVLLVSSMVFYFFGEPIYVLLLVLSSVSDYIWSLLIEKFRGQKKTKMFLIMSLIINLGLLGFFKYIDFFIGSVNAVFGTDIPVTGVPLPIGISFFTFQTMSYTIDVYRGRASAQRNFGTFATFVCLFPQLIAGPIVRYTDVAAELEERSSTLDNVSYGVRRFTVGLGKKVLLANAMGELTLIFQQSDEKTVVFYWLYAIAYTLQVYFDFSGYSDMAIGLGSIFGFRFPENFNYPFVARSITDFWRRWHMTLGSWFRDYVYIPMGGNRGSKGKWLMNIAVVWLLTGLWHGASWNFVLWGAFFGVALSVEKLWLHKILEKSGRVIQHIYVLFLVVISFVIFNANGLGGVVTDIGGLFGAGDIPFFGPETMYYLKSYGFLIVLTMIGSVPLIKNCHTKISNTKKGQVAMGILEPVGVAVLLIVVTAYLVDGSFNPFLYFRF